MEDYKFGHVYDKKIEIEDADKFATLFGEGSEALTELIKYCIVNNIPTLASCKGHPENKNIVDRINEKGYLTFKFTMYYDEDDFAYFLSSIPLSNKEITVHLESNPDLDRTLTFYVPASKKNMSEKYFRDILVELIKYQKLKKENKVIPISDDIKKIVDHEFECWNDEAFDITYKGYKKYARNGMYIEKVASCPKTKYTSILHKKFSNQEKMIDEFVEAEKKL